MLEDIVCFYCLWQIYTNKITSSRLSSYQVGRLIWTAGVTEHGAMPWLSTMEEVWKEIEGYEGKYQVSNFGRVKSLNYSNTGEEHILKQGKTGRDKDYYCVGLSKNGKLKSYLVHRLVAIAFIQNPNNLPQVNHKDEDKSNNCVWNLEWCDNDYNSNYGTRNEKVAKSKNRKTYQYKGDVLVAVWDNALIPAQKYGYCVNLIYDSINYNKKAYGYYWKRK